MTWPRTSLPWEAPEAMKEREADHRAHVVFGVWDTLGRSLRESPAWDESKRECRSAVPLWNGAKVEG